MEFIKEFTNKRFARLGHGTLVITEKRLTIRLLNNKEIVRAGFVDGGIGIITEDRAPTKSPYTILTRKNVNKEYLPEEMKTKSYKYYVPAKKLSDNEYVFLFENAKILNRK